MARKTAKKQAEAPKVDIGAEIFASLRELEKLKGIPVDYMVERLKQALTNAYRKDREDRRDVPADNVVVDLSEKGLSMHIVKTAVEEVEDTALEIPIDAARNYNPDVQVGDPVNIPVDIQKFGRIAAQTAKQVVIQGIREAERGVAYESYSNKAQELMTVRVTVGSIFIPCSIIPQTIGTIIGVIPMVSTLPFTTCVTTVMNSTQISSSIMVLCPPKIGANTETSQLLMPREASVHALPSIVIAPISATMGHIDASRRSAGAFIMGLPFLLIILNTASGTAQIRLVSNDLMNV